MARAGGFGLHGPGSSFGPGLRHSHRALYLRLFQRTLRTLRPFAPDTRFRGRQAFPAACPFPVPGRAASWFSLFEIRPVFLQPAIIIQSILRITFEIFSGRRWSRCAGVSPQQTVVPVRPSHSFALSGNTAQQGIRSRRKTAVAGVSSLWGARGQRLGARPANSLWRNKKSP